MFDLISSEYVYNGKVMDIKRDVISLPNGATAVRETIVRGGACAVVPVDDEGNIYLVKQYRHAIGKEMVEIPAGMMNPGETPLQCAMREMEEEIGLKAGNMKFVSKMYLSVGVCNELLHLYIATDLKPGVQHLDPDEFIEIKKYKLEDAYKMIFDGSITDAKSMFGILAYKHLSENRQAE